MNSPERSSRNLGFSDIGQIIAIAAPVLFIMGRVFDYGYYIVLDCFWVAQIMSVQETIIHSALITSVTLTGLASGIFVLQSDPSFFKMMKPIICVEVVLLTVYVIALTIGQDRYASSVLVIGCWMALFAFGAHLGNLYYAHKRADLPWNISLGFCVLSIFVLVGLAYFNGMQSARSEIENKDISFPELTEINTINNQSKLYLISSVAGKFLVVKYNKNKMSSFKLENDLSKYVIKPVSTFR